MSWFRRIGIALLVLVVVAAAGVGTLYAVTNNRIASPFAAVKPHLVTVHADAATIERGKHIATAVVKCQDCHKADFGGGIVVDDPAIGTVAATNLTTGAGGVLAKYDDALLERAIRHGVGYDGRGLWVMPSSEVTGLADDDLAALIAYLRSLPPVDRTVPANRLGPVGRALYVAGKLPLIGAEEIDPNVPHPATMPPAPTAEYGKYAARIGGCFGCHGETMSGGPIPGGPPDWKPAANITPTGLAAYDEAKFVDLMRTGVRPGGTKVDSLMPYRYTKDLNDDELHAIWLYLKTVPPKEFGNR
jgi:mono/diheme cytochrome c family protein